MHPIHVLLARAGGYWMGYDPVDHALVDLPHSLQSAAAAREMVQKLVDVEHGVVIGLVAEPGRTAAKYENHESLVWRDAGVVLGYMSIVAEALSLSFCPLGITGSTQLTSFLPGQHGMHGVGLAVLGAT